jgi:hypothetical protein
MAETHFAKEHYNNGYNPSARILHICIGARNQVFCTLYFNYY